MRGQAVIVLMVYGAAMTANMIYHEVGHGSHGKYSRSYEPTIPWSEGHGPTVRTKTFKSEWFGVPVDDVKDACRDWNMC